MRIPMLLLTLAACAKNTPPTAGATPATPSTEPVETGDSAFAQLEAHLESLAAHDRWQGSIAIVDPSGPLFMQAEGVLEPGGTPIDTNTRFRIGSITKMYTAVVVMQLVDEGKLTLDSPLSTWFPQVPNAEQVTLEQLLDHHSGIYSFTDAKDYPTWMTQPITQEALLAKIASSTPEFEPGAKGRYSNSGYVLLGMVIEAVEGQPYADVVQKRILDPLGTKLTSYGGAIDPSQNQARSMAWNGRAWELQPETDMSVPGAAGALISTPLELCTFIRAVFDGTVVSPTGLSVMQTLDGKYGHGLFRFPFGKRWSWGHTGGIDGFSSMLSYFPDDGRCFAMTTHAENTDGNAIAIAALNTAYGTPWTSPVITSPVVLDAAALEAFVGVYTSDELPLDLTVSVVDGLLQAQGTGQPPFTLTAEGPRTFVFAPIGLKLEFGEDGAMTLHQGGVYAFQRQP